MQISQKTAQKIVFGMLIVAVILAIARTFIHPDLAGAMIGISSGSILYWVYRNPELLMTQNINEFNAIFARSRDMKYFKGFPLLYILTLALMLYFWLR